MRRRNGNRLGSGNLSRVWWLRLAVILAAALLLSQAPGARALALTLHVNTTTDGLHAGACAANTPGQCTLREAIAEGDAAPGSTITVPAGTYTLTIAPSGADDNTTGDLNITAPMTITGSGATATIVRAGTTPASGIDRVLSISSAGAVTLSGMAIRNGLTNDASDGCCDGGGILTVAGSSGGLTLTNVTLSGNTATSGPNCPAAARIPCFIAAGSAQTRGGARTALHAALAAKLANATSRAVPPSAFSASGGGLGADGTGAVTLTNVTITGNTAVSRGNFAHGGGIGEEGGSSSNLTNVVLSNNTANDTASSADAGGISTNAVGGGLVEDGGGAFTLTNVTVSGNSVLTSTSSGFNGGGGIDEEGSGSVTL
jgi:hypothetical protein